MPLDVKTRNSLQLTRRRIQEFLIGGGAGPNFGSDRTVELFLFFGGGGGGELILKYPWNLV